MLNDLYTWLVNHMDEMEITICALAVLTLTLANIVLIGERRKQRHEHGSETPDA